MGEQAMRRRKTFISLLSLCLLGSTLMAVEPIPLNDHTRLGQRLTATMPWNGVWLTAPSWSDNEGGFTLSLWDSPKRGKLLAQQAFVGIVDNARVELWLPTRTKPGTLYWEIDKRTGTTRVGLYSDVLTAETEDCAYLDGVPDRKRSFRSGPSYSPGRKYADTKEMLAALKPDAELTDRIAACRELAFAGTAEAIPVLAGLLADEKLSHAARIALETMPNPAVDDAFRKALISLQGRLLVGVINSIGVRRDGKAVTGLTQLLNAPDQEVASAAAVALGRIGTPPAGKALAAALTDTRADTRPAVLEGSLNCAEALGASGQKDQALQLFARLSKASMPLPIREAGIRGTLLASQPGSLPLLIKHLHSPDLPVFRVAAWVFQREFPGADVTRTVAAELAKLPARRRPLLVEALGGRGDPAGLPALVAALAKGEKDVRSAAVRSLSQIGGDPVVPPLAEALIDPDAAVAGAARASLLRLRSPAVDPVLIGKVGDPKAKLRVAAIGLLGQRQVKAALPPLLKILREPEPPVVRVAALNALRSLAGISEIAPLVQALANAKEPAERKAAEGALVTVCGRCGPEAAKPVLKALAGAPEGSEAPLLRAMARAGGQQALDAVIQRLKDARAPIRQEALSLLTAWRERTAVPPLLAVAEKPRDDREGILAIRALVRLAGPRKGAWETDLKLLTEAMRLSKRPDEKRLALGVLGSVATRETLILATRALVEPAISKEAATAIVTIAEKLPRPGDGDIRVAMEKVLASTQDAKLRARSERVLAKHRASLAATAKKLAGKLPGKAPATPLKPRRLLIFDVNVGYGGHPSRFAANDAFTLMGTATGAYETVLSRDPQVFQRQSLKQFDAVLLNNTVGLPFEDPALQQSLVEFVYGGGGLLGIHGSIFTFIDWGGKRGDTWPEFGTMLGARGGTHASQREHVFVKLDDPTNPVNAVFGRRDFEYRDEFFRVIKPYSRDRVRVLLSIDGQKTDLASHKLPEALKKKNGDYPLAWVRHYGRGRVFYSTIGHNSFVFEEKNMLEFYLAAIQFALGDLPVPTIPSSRLNPATQAREKLGWRLGMTTYSLHKHTFFEAMEKTQKLGLPYINGLCFQKVSKEIPRNFGPDLTDPEIKQIRLKLDATHARLLTHYIGDIPGDEAGCRRAFEFARKLGIETLIAEPKLEALDIIEKFCDEYDIKVGLHNHGEKQSPNYWHPKRIMEVCKGRSKRIGACADIGYWMRSGIDPIEGIKTLGDRLITIQMHDLNELTPEGHDVPWGTGAGKTREVLQTIRELGLKPTMFGLEYSLDFLDNMPQMGQCAAFFNTVAIELAR